jgi:hypothetical protein
MGWGAAIGGLLAGAGSVGAAGVQSQGASGGKWAYPGSPNLFQPQLSTTYGGASALLAAQMGQPFESQMQVAGPLANARQAWSSFGWGGSKGARRMRQYSAKIARIYSDYKDLLRNGIPAQFGVVGYVPPEAVANMSVEDVIRFAPKRWGVDETKAVDELKRLAAISGWDNYDQLFRAQLKYEKETEESLVAMGVARDAANEMIQRSAEMRTEIMEGMAIVTEEDIEDARQVELDRMEAEFDRTDRELLRAAQEGGFNPGRGLEESARLRSTGQNDALARALSLISAEQAASAQQLALVDALDPSKQFLPLVPDMTRAGLPHQVHAGQPSSFTSGANPWADAVQNVGNIAGEAVATYYQNQQANRRHAETLAAMNSPAYAPTTTVTNDPVTGAPGNYDYLT